MASYNFSLFGFKVSQTLHFETVSWLSYPTFSITQVKTAGVDTQHTGSAELSEEIHISSGEEIILSDSANQKRSTDIRAWQTFCEEREQNTIAQSFLTWLIPESLLFLGCQVLDKSQCVCVCVLFTVSHLQSHFVEMVTRESNIF